MGSHFLSYTNTSRPVATASMNAVKKEICRGDMFLVENIVTKLGAARILSLKRRHSHKLEGKWLPEYCKLSLQFKFIPYAFHSGDAINAQLLPDLPDMHVNGPVSHNHFIPPHLVEDLIAEENAAGLLRQQV